MDDHLDKKRNAIEIYIGGAIALVAIIVIITKFFIDGATFSAGLDMIIEIAGLLVSALVMLVAIKSIAVNSPKNLKEQLIREFDRWEDGNRPLVFRVTDYQVTDKYKICYAILARHTDFLTLPKRLSDEDVKKYMTRNSKSSGKFISLPSLEDMIQKDEFFMEFHFIESSYKDAAIKDIVEKTVNCLNGRFDKVTSISKSSNDFTVYYKKITTKDEIFDLFALFNFVLKLMLIQS